MNTGEVMRKYLNGEERKSSEAGLSVAINQKK